MDDEENTRQLKWLAIGVIAFFMSLYYSWTEIRYIGWSQVVLADVQGIRTVTSRRRWSSSQHEVVDYQFSDAAGRQHRQHARIPDGMVISQPGQISIRYVGDDSPISRLEGDSNWIPFVMLGVSTIGLGWFLKSMHAAANA